MGIMDNIFGRGSNQPPAPAPVAKEAAPNNTQVDPAHLANNTQVPNQQTTPPQPTGEKSPFEQYKDLWEAPKDGNTGIPKAAPDFTLNPEQLLATAKSIDFTAGFDQQKLVEVFGDKAPVVKELMQQVGQNGFVQNFSIGIKAMEGATGKLSSNLTDKTIPEMLRRERISGLTGQASDLFTNPATAPMMKSLETQFAAKYPAATPEQIRDHAVSYFDAMASEHVRSRGKQIVEMPKQDGASVNTDWADWAGVETQQ